jgi:hypothetical protein
MSDDFDSPWKEALDFYFEAFMALLFPSAYALIDWSRGYESLDKEFQQVVREAEIGRRYVDKLVRVWTKAGKECWVLIHVEVQTDRDPDFASRMYVYNYRIFDRYNVPVASLAVLADDDPNWRPHEFRQALFDCEVGIRFPAVKLLDFVEYETELEASENPFAKIVLAHLKARQTQKDVVNRQTWKLRLVRGLYVRGFSAKDVRELFRLIDWLMVLPPPIEVLFRQDLDSLQKEKGMPYVTSIERVARRELLRKSIRIGLKIKFGDEGLKLMPEIENIHDGDLLDKILESLETAATLDDVRRFWADQPLQE